MERGAGIPYFSGWEGSLGQNNEKQKPHPHVWVQAPMAGCPEEHTCTCGTGAGRTGRPPTPSPNERTHLPLQDASQERGKRLTAGFGQFGPFRRGSGEEERRDQEACADFV